MTRTTSFCYLPAPSELLPKDRLFFDDSISPESAEALSQLGIESVAAATLGLAGSSVTEQLLHAVSDQRMFVTKILPLSLYFNRSHVGVLVVSRGVTHQDLVHHLTTRMPLVPFPQDVYVHSVKPLGDYIESRINR